MSADITVPQLGESIVEATVGRWLKNQGDVVSVGEPLVELETDKVNMEVAATSDGVLQSIVKPEGETVAIGDVLAVLDESKSGNGASSTGEQAPRAQAQAAETSPPPTSGSVQTGNGREPEAEEEETGEGVRATPLARRMAAEHGIDLNSIHGTGPSGRVRREDVVARIGGGHPQDPPPTSTISTGPDLKAAPSQLEPASDVAIGGRLEERKRLSRRRQTIARRLVEAQHTAAMLTTFNEIDMSGIMDVRKRRRDTFKERYGVNLGYMSFFTRAVVGSLKAFPTMNAEIQGDEVVIKHYYDIGIAVASEEGLVVPVVRDADRLSFAEIERQIAELAQKARSQTLSLAELQGGTFTITNGGIFGSLLSTPILNTPQVGILGMHKIEQRPMVVDGEILIRPMMYVAMSYDHRLIDGSEAVRFVVRIKELLEDPETLLLEG